MIGDQLLIVVLTDEFTHCLRCASTSLSSNHHCRLLLLPVIKPTRYYYNAYDGQYIWIVSIHYYWSWIRISVITYSSSCHHLYCCFTLLHTLKTELYKQWCSYIYIYIYIYDKDQGTARVVSHNPPLLVSSSCPPIEWVLWLFQSSYQMISQDKSMFFTTFI